MYVLKLKKGAMNVQQDTKHTTHKTQIDRQVEKKTYKHDIDSEDRQTDKECA